VGSRQPDASKLRVWVGTRAEEGSCNVCPPNRNYEHVYVIDINGSSFRLCVADVMSLREKLRVALQEASRG
jgi:hypothetical protein